MSTELILLLTVVVASFVRGVSGFGAALVMMPVLSGLIGIQAAAPLVAIIGLTNDSLLCFYYRRSFEWNIVSKLWAGSIFGIPVGFLILRFFPARWMLSGLGVMITAYAVYALLTPALPILKSRRWIYGTCLLCGTLSGRYNIPAPPFILYGNSLRCCPQKFMTFLLVFFCGNGLSVVSGQLFATSYTVQVLVLYEF